MARKIVPALLLLLLVTVPVLSQAGEICLMNQEPPENEAECAAGTRYGEIDGEGNSAYFLAGLAGNIIGFAFAVTSDPSPDAYVLEVLAKEKGETYMLCYKEAYRKAGKKKNMLAAGVGWLIGTGIILAISFSGT